MLSMAALSIGHYLHCTKSPIQKLKTSQLKYPRIVVVQPWQRKEPVDGSNPGEKKVKKQVLRQVFGGVEKLGRKLKDELSPKQNGDWKDAALMSLSFAIYVYMSQLIVCAYCAWVSMAKQPW